jgi:hypothetical protein
VPNLSIRRASALLISLLAFILVANALLLPRPAFATIPGCLAGPIVAEASTPTGSGYWLAASDGGVFSFGDARFFGSAASLHLNKPVVGIVPTPSGKGYWLVAGDGGVFAYGDAVAPAGNPLPGLTLNQPIVGATAAPNGGLWLTAADGGVFALGGAQFYGSAANLHLNKPVVGIVSSPSGKGYWLIAADGGVFAYGDAQPVAGNPLPGMQLNQPIVGATRIGSTNGLVLTAGDGGVFALNGAPFYGSASNLHLAMPVSAIAANPGGSGYWLAAQDGGVFAYGSAGFFGNAVSSNGNCNATQPTSTSSKIVKYATAIMNGQAEPGWGGGSVPYSWGGGHASNAGPSLGTCAGYTGSIKPCPASKTVGVDCSGFARWVYKLAYGSDVLGAVNTNGEIAVMHRVSSPQAGDLVFYGTGPSNTHHVGVYIGNGKMIDALKTGTHVETDAVNIMSDVVGYYAY